MLASVRKTIVFPFQVPPLSTRDQEHSTAPLQKRRRDDVGLLEDEVTVYEINTIVYANIHTYMFCLLVQVIHFIFHFVQTPCRKQRREDYVGSLEDEVTACKYIMWAHSYMLYSAGAGAEEDNGGDG